MDFIMFGTNNFSIREGNYSKPDKIVLHITNGNFGNVICRYQDINVKESVHMIISETGKIAKMVPLELKSLSNSNALPTLFNRDSNPDDYCINIAMESIYHVSQGKINDIQIELLVKLIQYVRQTIYDLYGNIIPINRDFIVGANELDSNKNWSPGEKFPWDKILNKLYILDEKEPLKNNKFDQIDINEFTAVNTAIYYSYEAMYKRFENYNGLLYLYDKCNINDTYRVKANLNDVSFLGYVTSHDLNDALQGKTVYTTNKV